MKETSNFKILSNGIFKENPTFIQLLGMCPTLAVTTSLINAVGMGLSATFVLIFSNLVISLLRKFIPEKIRIASYIVIIAAFVSIIEMLLKAYLPAISEALVLQEQKALPLKTNLFHQCLTDSVWGWDLHWD